MIVFINMNRIKFLSNLNQIIEGLIFEIYFPDHMKAPGIDVLELVKLDIAEVFKPLSPLGKDSSPLEGEQLDGEG